MNKKTKYWILFTDIEQWTGNSIIEWIPLENAKNERGASAAMRKWLQENRGKVDYSESTGSIKLVKLILPVKPKSRDLLGP